MVRWYRSWLLMRELFWMCLLLGDAETVAASCTADFCCCLAGCVGVVSWYQQRSVSEETRGDPQKTFRSSSLKGWFVTFCLVKGCSERERERERERKKERAVISWSLCRLLAGVKTSTVWLACSYASSAAATDKALIEVLWPEGILSRGLQGLHGDNRLLLL